MVERDIHIEANGNRLAGTLCTPADTGRFPMVLMVHGSGALDRDENIKGQKLEIFNAVAHHLAMNGIASLRYDKRGCGASRGDYYSAGHLDLVSDVICWYDALRLTDVCASEQLFLLGHSEGCLVAAQASLRRPAVAGLALLCPFVEPMEDILLRQARQIEWELAGRTGVSRLVQVFIARIAGDPVASQRALIRKIRGSRKASVRVGFMRVPANWLRELLSINTSEIFTKVTCPILLVGGEKDLQCDPGDVARIAALTRGLVTSQVIAGMTHVLRCDDQPPSLLGVRRLLGRPVEPKLLELVAEWMRIRAAPGNAERSA